MSTPSASERTPTLEYDEYDLSGWHETERHWVYTLK